MNFNGSVGILERQRQAIIYVFNHKSNWIDKQSVYGANFVRKENDEKIFAQMFLKSWNNRGSLEPKVQTILMG